MAWYKKQLIEKLKELEGKKPKTKKGDEEDSEKQTKPSFDPNKLKGNKRAFKNPVAEMNKNRKKTDIF